MSWIDYAITLVPFAIILVVLWRTRRYMTSVADFMAASRCGGRYLVCNAAGEAATSVVGSVAAFELFYKAGFSVTWWSQIGIPVSLLLTLTGFVIYRYRETRVMTLAQFFEIRYGKGFRVLAGIMAFLSGIVNYGIFPAVGARFFANYCGLPQTVSLLGFTLPTFVILMACFISMATFMTLVGGQLTIMISDCLQGLISGFLFLIVATALLWIFPWSNIFAALSTAPVGQSMLNPFDTGQAQDFNIWFVLLATVTSVYSYGSWQGGSAFRASAASPHEAKMGSILSSWRVIPCTLVIVLLSVCAFTYLNNPHYAAGAARVNATLQNISSPEIRTQMRVPVALSYFLPVGIKGAFACIMFFGMLACDGSYMHSWGTIFIQDIILPFRKKPFKPETHIRLLRCAIAGVGLFAFFFGWLFSQTEYILMFFAITSAIFLGGSGCAVLGGLYWKKGTNPAAWTGMLTGSSLAVGGIAIQQCWTQLQPHLLGFWPSGWIHNYLAAHADKFPLNGQVVLFIAVCTAIFLYVTISLLTCREDFNLDRMLHRGQYALESSSDQSPPTARRRFSWGGILGFDRDFTLGDKIISSSVFVWSLFWFFVFAIGSLWYLWRPFPLKIWGDYWYIYAIILPFVIGIITTSWFTWGGIRDLYRLFRSLRTVKRSSLDDGMVVNHRNLDETTTK